MEILMLPPQFIVVCKNFMRLVPLVAVALAPCLAYAALGEPEASVQTDVAEVKGTVRIMDRLGYRVHEIRLASGTVVREFAAPDGMVFAIAWSGPTVPDLRQTLGRYFDDFVTSAKANRLGHHHLAIRQNDLVVEAAGHMRAFSGRAFLPSAMPAGISIAEVR
jgi:Protein of unknown function (DUF2844)